MTLMPYARPLPPARSVKAALGLLGLRAAGGNYRAFHEALARLGIEPPVPSLGDTSRFGRVPDDAVFCENSTFLNRKWIKERLIAEGVPAQCAMPGCEVGTEWNGAPLVLQLDHINGVFDDSRRENLRLLCPNCHSQTKTFAGRRTRSSVRCPHCPALVRPTAKRCWDCKRWLVTPQGRPPKIDWPVDAVLLSMVSANSMVAVGKQLGVSDNAVRKRLRSRGLIT